MKILLLKSQKFYCLIVLLLLGNFMYAQTIKGQVSDTLKNPIVYVNVILRDSLNKQIINYTTTDEQGRYEITVKEAGEYVISFNALSYQPKSEKIIFENYNLTWNVTLQEQATELNEVIIQTEKAIVVKKDTVILTVGAFLKGNETTVEDLLKNLPGFNVAADGTVKIGNQEIEKVMVDGDDFFKKRYQLLTKNLNADLVEKVEIYQKYSNNRLLKDIEESHKVAVNLKLKKDRKIDWFGNASLAYGLTTANRYQVRANAMRFGEVGKHYFLTNLNNIGESSGGESSIYISASDLNEVGAIGNREMARSLICLDAYELSLKKSRFNLNNQELLSLNSIFKINEKIKIITNGLFNWDEKAFVQQSIQNYSTSSVSFTNRESNQVNKTMFSGSGAIDFDYDISQKELLEIDATYKRGDENSNSQLEFNSVPIHQFLSDHNERFTYKTIYTNKLAAKKVLALSGVYIYEKKPQNYTLDTVVFGDLFPDVDVTSASQFSNNQMYFTGFEAHLLDRKKKDDLLELKIGFTNRIDFLKSHLDLIDFYGDEVTSDFKNDLKYTVGKLYANAKYKIKFGNYALNAKLDFNQLFNNFESYGNEESQSPLFVSPSLSLSYEINENNKLSLSYNNNFTNASLLQVFDDYVLTNNKDFLRGGAGLNQVNSSGLTLGYSLGRWTKSFFATARVSYLKSHDFFSTNTIIDPDYTLTNIIRINDSETLIGDVNIDRYLKFMTSNLKLKFSFFKSDFKNSVNNSELRLVQNTSYEYGFELRSAFDGLFNYNLGTKWNSSVVKTTSKFSNTNNTSFLDLNFNFNQNFNAEIQSERYYFGNFNTDKSYYFLDFETKYKIKKRNVTFTLTGKNLLNVKTFRERFISDIGTFSTSYRLMPRILLLGIDFSF
ncbi:TonB-dependent receptor [Gelidibacter maritimus]|uniref:TonB-dependent receptor n=1 Tax=Gelidibacter maritimus TaxID=2761487 RepID=A0A7W2R2L9_9FLAO|nr:TonB-dependent receptor [Gelidibacter maritimus]MBA6151723.1 TonB-dependent receptor [Gelidibacter maritimus]